MISNVRLATAKAGFTDPVDGSALSSAVRGESAGGHPDEMFFKTASGHVVKVYVGENLNGRGTVGQIGAPH